MHISPQPLPSDTRPSIPAGPYATTRKIQGSDGNFVLEVSGGGRTVRIPGRTVTIGVPDQAGYVAKATAIGAAAGLAVYAGLSAVGVDMGWAAVLPLLVGGACGYGVGKSTVPPAA